MPPVRCGAGGVEMAGIFAVEVDVESWYCAIEFTVSGRCG